MANVKFTKRTQLLHCSIISGAMVAANGCMRYLNRRSPMAEANSRSIELTLCLVPMAALLEHSAAQAETRTLK